MLTRFVATGDDAQRHHRKDEESGEPFSLEDRRLNYGAQLERMMGARRNLSARLMI